jgi:N-acetylglucosaminyldiphosphoundecaprenol N-acetyl-beta-D-mannosaminyltransferase
MAIRPSPDYQRPVYDIAGLPFDAIGMDAAVGAIVASLESRTPLFISTPNLNFLVASQKDRDFRESVYQSDLCLADGMPIVWLARVLGVPLPGRVAGSDLFEALCAQNRRTVKVFFFGGPDGVARKAAGRVNRMADERRNRQQIPGAVCVGYDSPGFGSLDEMSHPDVIKRINDSGADFVIVALGASKGQAWIQRNRRQIDAPVISHLGAVVNMAAGSIARAPRWMRAIGLEWIWRIKEEPQLWRRYASDGLALLGMLVTQVLPTMLSRWRHRWFGRHPASGQLECARVEGACRLCLRGVWTQENIGELRAQLQVCGKRGDTVTVDTRGAAYLDAAVRGLLAIVPASC